MADNPFSQSDPEPLTYNAAPASGPAPVPDELLEKAVKRVQSVVRGNGMRGLQVALSDFEGEIITFEAYEVFRIDPQIAEKRGNGKQNGEVTGSLGDMRARMQAALGQITENADVKKYVSDLLKKRKDLGFALENQTVSLDAFNKNYVVHEVCTSCSGSKALSCSTCHGDGRSTCHRCKGAMLVECPLCHGHRTIAAGGGRKTCTKCNGKGRAQCQVCRGRGITACQQCKGTGKLICQQCGATGWHSTIGALVVKAKCHFWYDKNALISAENAPELPPVIDVLGPKMVLEQHAHITVIEDPARLRELDRQVQNNEFKIPYLVRLPWGTISFRLKDQIISAKLFGLHPELIEMEPFLEEPLTPGIKLLEEAGRTSGNAAAKVKDASRFRAIGEALVLASRMKHNRAFEALEKRYPFGIRNETLHQMLSSADLALKNITRRPRQTGVLMGLILSLIVLCGFYLAPVRAQIYPSLSGDIPRIAIDLVLLVVVMGITWMMVQVSATRALQDAMKHLIPPDKRKTLRPKAGQTGWIGVAVALLLWISMAIITQLMGISAPLWFEKILALIN